MKALYCLKQSGKLWYDRITKSLLTSGYINSLISPCIFIKREADGSFAIVALYVDDVSIFGYTSTIEATAQVLERDFEMKRLGPSSFCIGIQIEPIQRGTFLHQTTYTRRILERFNMMDCHSVSTPMVNRPNDARLDPFRPSEPGENLLDEETPYLAAVGALMYLSSQTRPDISFAVNLLARFSRAPTMRHWVGVKHVFRYLKGTMDHGLFYENRPRSERTGLTGYADAGYNSDPHTGKSQGYVFLYNGTAVSWKSTKQTLVTTSTNHSEIIALHEASRECVWLRRVINHITKSTGLSTSKVATTVFEDNSSCIAQMQSGFIKGDRTKHIDPKFFFTHDLIREKEIDLVWVPSSENAADLFTKALGASVHRKHSYKIGLRSRKELTQE